MIYLSYLRQKGVAWGVVPLWLYKVRVCDTIRKLVETVHVFNWWRVINQ